MKNLIFTVIVLLGSSNAFGASEGEKDVTCGVVVSVLANEGEDYLPSGEFGIMLRYRDRNLGRETKRGYYIKGSSENFLDNITNLIFSQTWDNYGVCIETDSNPYEIKNTYLIPYFLN